VKAHSFARAIPTPSGTALLVLLALLLGGFAVGVDVLRAAGPSPESAASLSAPLAVAALLSAGLGYGVIPLLRRLRLGQFVQADGPQAHLQKAGTPTMGGAFFVPVAVAVAVFWTRGAPEVLAVSAVTLAYGAIGWSDDWQILRQRSNAGISPRLKLGLQVAVAIAFCLWLAATGPAELTAVSLPLGWVLPLGALFWPLAVFVFAAESNATNLTDGVDGLAAGTAAIALLGLGALVAPNAGELAVFCAATSGSCLGFAYHNRNPARAFMGDTGSLALGGALAAVGLAGASLWELFVVSGLFFAESVSTIAQVGYYKATKDAGGRGNRLLKMAPLHHHLELTGWSETQVVGAFYLLSALLVGLAFVLR